MMTRIQEKPADEWMQDCIDNGGVVATKYQTSQQALNDPDIVANGHAQASADGGVQLGPLARLSVTPGEIGKPIEADAGRWQKQWLQEARAQHDQHGSPTTAKSDPSKPLAGIKVVEIATIIAAPLGASFLADLGADVVKVEQLGGDPYRGLLAGMAQRA